MKRTKIKAILETIINSSKIGLVIQPEERTIVGRSELHSGLQEDTRGNGVSKL